jgi:uncharacterized protein YndB with AHSA1/START domain
MWSTESTQRTGASPALVWRRLADPRCWPEHDPQLQRAELRGPLAVGSRIRITPKGGPASDAEIVACEPERRLVTVARMPGCALRVDQRLEPRDGETVLRHRIELSGLSAPLFRRLFVGAMADGVPAVLADLTRLAESDRRATGNR